jgi:hypothetical protein
MNEHRVKELIELIDREKDSQKVLALVTELNELLDETKRLDFDRKNQKDS